MSHFRGVPRSDHGLILQTEVNVDFLHVVIWNVVERNVVQKNSIREVNIFSDCSTAIPQILL